jgi:hypothetical protein
MLDLMPVIRRQVVQGEDQHVEDPNENPRVEDPNENIRREGLRENKGLGEGRSVGMTGEKVLYAM